MIAGGGAPEIELSLRLTQHANTLTGMEQYCFREYAQALEVIPFTLSENAGLNPIATVTELRNKHAKGEIAAGINVRKVRSLRSHNCFCCIVDLCTYSCVHVHGNIVFRNDFIVKTNKVNV